MPKKSGGKKSTASHGKRKKAPPQQHGGFLGSRGHVVVVHAPAGQQGKGFLSGLLKPLAGAAIDLIPI